MSYQSRYADRAQGGPFVVVRLGNCRIVVIVVNVVMDFRGVCAVMCAINIRE
jgi:hypothetical protein